MPKAKGGAAARSEENRPIIKVDTDQRDTSKAVSRVQSRDDDEGLPGQSDDDGDGNLAEKKFLSKSRAVSKRLTRIQRKYDQQLAEQEARHQRELRDVRGEVDRLKARSDGDGGSASEAAHESAMRDLEAKLTKAMEDGNSQEAARINREMARKEAEFWNARTSAVMGGDQQRRDQRSDDRGQDQTQQQQRRQPSRAGIAFTEANEWWDDPDYYVEKQAANAIFGRLVEEEGADPEDPGTYRRVAKRLAKKFPELEIELPGRRRDDDDEDDEDDDDDGGTRSGAKRRAAEAPVQHTRHRDPDYRPSRRAGEQHLSQRDLDTMRSIGLDPDNEKHLLHFAQGKRETEDMEMARR